ncbi:MULTISPECIES: LysR family transcriptional regulator [Pseudovibrio]|uniref:LysR family transcriptional regulator n=1 Tax=Stappiaceae TaxID=2821832 RepID=UPI002365B830|nr:MULTISPECIES: LysR family transcriptional regulator [Pseudovibrio]MDD7911813.1 LysR family transcriptional regulator [Pseudovibrio exalbescens]MDX5594738.1 LysR family transcriptional regulator [Pseudovibrio sp. SPO723]
MDSITRIRCFLKVVEKGGFSSAARDMGRSKALVSKYVGELEDELGARLLNRTTRQISLTEVGQAYYREAGELLQRFDDLKNSIQQDHQEARGLLRVSAPRSMGDFLVTQAMIDFLAEHPEVRVELHLDDRFVDIVEEGFDVAIRVTELTDSSLIARKVRDFKTVVCVRPDLLERYGEPQHPSELAKVPCVIDTNYRNKSNWGFEGPDGKLSVAVKGPIEVNSAVTARQAALAGLGFLRTPELFVGKQLQTGELVPVLEDYLRGDLGIYAVYPHRRHLSGKVRAFVDYLVKWFKDYDKKNAPQPVAAEEQTTA